MRIVPIVHTPMTAVHARDALLAALPALDRASAALLLGLIWVETGRGNLLNWNAGNITASDKWPGDAWRPPWFESSSNPHLAELHERMLNGQAPSAFRAYDSAAQGFADFAGTLKRQFPSVLAAAATGDATAFVGALHDSGYSRDYRAVHIGTFAQLQHQFAELVSHLPAGAIAGAGAGVGLAAAALAIVLLVSKRKRRKAERWSSKI